MLHVSYPDAKKATAAIADGILRGTIVLTLKGEMPVERLMPGDKVITRDSGVSTVRAIESMKTVVQTVKIKAGSLGQTRPEDDVVVPAEQDILVRDWRARSMFGKDQAIVSAIKLIDDEFILDNGLQDATLFQVCFDSDHVFYAGGLEVQSHSSALAKAA